LRCWNSIRCRKTNVKKKVPENVVVEYTDLRQFLPWLTQLAFILAIGLTLARGMNQESVREPFSALESSTPAPRACGAAGSMVLDLLMCLPALLVLLRRVLDKNYIVRFTWAEALLCAFAGWAVLSVAWAGDKFDALVESSHLVAAAALFWAMAQLVRSWLRLRIVAGACMGLLIVYVAQGLHYKFVDVPDTAKFWQAHRAEEMRSHGWQEGDYALKQYELKVLGGEMMGFHSSPNSFAATIVMLSVIVGGVGIQRIVNKDESGIIGATILPVPFALFIIYLTHSNAALATPVIAAGILVAIGFFAGVLNRKRTVAFSLCAIAIVLGTLAVIGHGIFHGSLPSASLNFRWRYWTAAMKLVHAHPLLGIGYGNFGNWFVSVRPAAAAEEVKDPHNLLVRALSELGIVGAVLLVGWLARVWWEWTNATRPGFASSTGTPGEGGGEGSRSARHFGKGPHPNPLPGYREKEKQTYGPRKMFATICSLSVLAVLVKILAGIDLSADASWVAYEIIKHIVFGMFLLIGIAIVVVRSSKDASIDDRPSPWILWAMLAALAVFLIHNAIDFSLFEPGSMMLFMLVGGAVLGVRSPSLAGQHKKTPIVIGAFSLATLCWIIAGIFVVVPLADAEGNSHAGDDALRQGNDRLAADRYQAAFLRCPVKNSDYAVRAARALLIRPENDSLTRAMLGAAIEACPQNEFARLMRARYMLRSHPDQHADIRGDYEEALKLNPNDLDTRLEYAQVLEQMGDKPAAAEQYRAALKTNEGFDPTEPKRLSETRVKEIEGKLHS
jgi:O-antigen ligase